MSGPDRSRIVPIVLGQGIGLLCGVIGVRLTSQLVPADVYGHYGIFVTFTPLGMWVVHVGLVKFMARHWAEAPDRGALWRGGVRAGQRKLGWLFVATGAAAFACTGAAWMFLFASAALLSWATLAQTALQAGREHGRDAAVVATSSVLRSFLPPLLYAAFGSILALYAGFCLYALGFALVAWAALRRQLRAGRVADPVAVPAVYDGPLFVALALSSWALTGVNRWIMAACFGPHETGYFTLASNLSPTVPLVLGTIGLQYFQPELFAHAIATANDRAALLRRVDRIALAHAALALAGLAALHVIAPLLVGPLIREAYRPALAYLVPAGCFALALSTALFFHTALLAGRRERACGPVDLATAVVLAGGGVITALVSEAWFLRWLCFAPVIPWLLTRPLARHHLLKPDAGPAPSPAP
jgi:hypothetical protein